MEFNNLASRLLLARFWKLQHLIPLDPPRSWMFFLRLLGKTVLRADVSDLQIRTPIFIIGTPRCGSTMLHGLLSCHEKTGYITNTMDLFRDPQVFYAVEWLRKTFDLNVRGERYLRDSIEVDAKSPSEGMRFWGEFLGRDPFELYWPERRAGEFSAEHIQKAMDYIRHVLYCFDKTGDVSFLNKSPALVTELRVLQDLFPDARFVHLVRDGRMVANSMIKLYRRQVEQNERIHHPLFEDHPFIPYPRVAHLKDYIEQWGPEDLRTTAHVWNDCLNFVGDVKNELRAFHEVRFEDILVDPRGVVGGIMDFCGLGPMVEGKTQYEEKISRVGKIQHKNVYQGFEVVEEIAGDNLRRFGYL